MVGLTVLKAPSFLPAVVFLPSHYWYISTSPKCLSLVTTITNQYSSEQNFQMTGVTAGKQMEGGSVGAEGRSGFCPKTNT